MGAPKVAFAPSEPSSPGPQSGMRSALLPLVLGVTGHRDLCPEQIPELRRQVQQMLRLIQQQWTQSQEGAGAPIILLSELAAGADQLVAEVALENGLEVIAVLPMPLEEYEKDFADPGELAPFRTLLKRSTETIALPADAGSRDLQYQAAGAYISRHCYILIALWDGVHIPLVGGTSHVVRMKLFGEAPDGPGALPSLEPAASGPVCHIPASRQSSPTQTDSAIRLLRAAGHGTAVKSSPLEGDLGIQATLRKLGTFNADWLRMAGSFHGKLYTAGGGLWTPSESFQNEEFLLYPCSVADAMASHFQVLSIRAIQCYFWLVLLAGMLRNFPAYRWVIAVSMFALIAIWAIYLYAKHRDFHPRYHEYRALSEALRVQVFWRLAGLKESVADYYLTNQSDDLSWICLALRAVSLRLSPPPTEDLPAVRKDWIESQLKYFQKSVRKNSRYSKLLTTAGSVTLFIAAPSAVLRLADASISAHIGVIGRILLEATQKLLASTSTMALAFLGYDNIRGFKEHSKRHAAMIPLFEAASRALANPHSSEAARQMILQLGREALAENGYWLVLHHQRKLDMPK
jgi:hypothetical protein